MAKDMEENMPDFEPGDDEMPDTEQGDLPNFLKPHHVGRKTKGIIKLLGVSSETSDYSDVIIRVEFNQKEYAIGLKLFSEDYAALKAKFGKKKSDWHGNLRYEVLKYKQTSYVSVKPA